MSERDDDELDDASLSSMRAVWLSMRDEEPPAAGMSALMAAAAARADQLRPQSWWERVVAQLRRPPVLAFATVMILIGGAVLVTRQSADEKVASLSADEPPARELQLREPRLHDEQASGPSAQTPTPAATATPVDEALPAEPPPSPGKDVVVAKPDPKPKTTPKPVRVKEEEKPGKNEPDRYRRFDDVDASKAGFSESDGRGDTAGTVLQTPGADPRVTVPSAPPPPPPPPPEKPAEKKPEPAAERVVSETKTDAPSNEQLVRQAETAATRGDCATVRAVVAKLKQQDEALFKARLGKNAAVAKCL